jgi:hypothetical protein
MTENNDDSHINNEPNVITGDDWGIQTQKAKTLFHYDEWDRDGSTRTKGYVNVIDYGSSLAIKPKLSVRKTGMFGTGRGSLNFQIVDVNYKPLATVAHKLTVGAVIGGSNTKEWGVPQIFDQNGRDRIVGDIYFCAASITTDYDRNGMPTDLDGWIKAVGDLKALYALAVGDYATVGKWIFGKLAKNPK